MGQFRDIFQSKKSYLDVKMKKKKTKQNFYTHKKNIYSIQTQSIASSS